MQKRRLQLKLKKLKYDIVADLRNTVLPILLAPKFRTNPVQAFPKSITHKKQRHLYRLRALGIDNLSEDSYIYVGPEDDAYIDGIIKQGDIRDPIVVINPGAKNHIKRWTVEGFAQLADRLSSESKASIIFAGSGQDSDTVNDITRRMKTKFLDLTNKTNIRQLAALFKRARLVVANDSAPLHLGCAMKTRVLAIFGPTDPKKYGPTGEFDAVISKKLHCSPCESADCQYHHECMKLITADEVYDAAKIMVEGYE
jgi:ADP-heptose:LPS heptosyltransferase